MIADSIIVTLMLSAAASRDMAVLVVRQISRLARVSGTRDTENRHTFTWVRFFRSEGPAGGHPARPPAVSGPLIRRTGPAVPPATASRGPPPAPAPGHDPLTPAM